MKKLRGSNGKKETFQIIGFRNKRINRMIAGLFKKLKDFKRPPDIPGRAHGGLHQKIVINMVRTGKYGQEAIVMKDLHRPEQDFFLA